jgi:hypothetical protein
MYSQKALHMHDILSVERKKQIQNIQNMIIKQNEKHIQYLHSQQMMLERIYNINNTSEIPTELKIPYLPNYHHTTYEEIQEFSLPLQRKPELYSVKQMTDCFEHHNMF